MLDPGDLGEGGGGLLSNVQVTITKAKYELWNYNKPDGKVIFAAFGYDPVDGDVRDEYYGPGKKVQDGAVIAGDNDGQLDGPKGLQIPKNSNYGIWIDFAKSAGLPGKFLLDLSTLVGAVVNVVQHRPNREGIDKPNEKGYMPSLTVIDKIISLPGESGVAVSTGNPQALEDKATKAILNAVSVKGTVNKADVAMIVFDAFPDDPQRSEIGKIGQDEDFLVRKAGEKAWTYANGVITK